MNSEETPELRSIWDEAKAHIERGDYDKAIETYRYILIRYADNTVAVEYANAYLGDIFLTTMSCAGVTSSFTPGGLRLRT